MLDGVQGVKYSHEGGLHTNKAVGCLYRRDSCLRCTTACTMTAAGAAVFDQDSRQHAKAIAKSVQVAHPVDPGMFETRNLGDTEPFVRYPHMDQRLDLEAIAPQPPVAPGRRRRGDVKAQNWDVLLPEHVEPVTEI